MPGSDFVRDRRWRCAAFGSAILFVAACVLVVLVSVDGVEAAPPSGLVRELSPDNFNEVVLDPTQNVFVKFYAPWCGHCQRFAPQWEALAKLVEVRRIDLRIVALDASRYRELADKHGVRSYPTIKLFPKKNKDGLHYTAARDPESLLTYALQHLDK